MRISMCLTVGVFVAFAQSRGAAVAAADRTAPFRDADGRGSKEDRERLKQEVIERMRALRMWKITEELKLDEATAARLFPLLARFDDQVRTLARERMEVGRAMRALVEAPNPDTAQLDTLVNRLLDNRKRRHALEDERERAVRKVLSPVQHAKLLLLMPMLEDGFRRRIHEVMSHDRDGFPGRHERRGPRPSE